MDFRCGPEGEIKFFSTQFFPSGDSKSDCLKFIFSKNKNGLINLAICCFVSEEAFALRFRYRFQYCSQFQRLEVKMG